MPHLYVHGCDERRPSVVRISLWRPPCGYPIGPAGTGSGFVSRPPNEELTFSLEEKRDQLGSVSVGPMQH